MARGHKKSWNSLPSLPWVRPGQHPPGAGNSFPRIQCPSQFPVWQLSRDLLEHLKCVRSESPGQEFRGIPANPDLQKISSGDQIPWNKIMEAPTEPGELQLI